MACADLRPLIERWRADPDSTYQTWFLWEERLKNFRSIRRGLQQVSAEMQAGTFGNLIAGRQWIQTHWVGVGFSDLVKTAAA